MGAISRPELKPFNLVFLAYQGSFEKEGISSAGQFISDARFGKIDAKSLVQAAVKQNRLPVQTLEDSSYLTAVESQLMSLYIQH
jgi:hypothetical protein